jgi:zinc transporter ZupT
MTKEKEIEFQLAKKKLAKLWLVFGSALFVLVFSQSLAGRFDPRIQEAWQWFLPTIMPTFMLIITVFIADGYANPSKAQQQVDRFIFRLAYNFSLGYLLLVLFTLIRASLSASEGPLFEMLRSSNLWLGPAQGVASALLGYFFVTNKEPAETRIQKGA